MRRDALRQDLEEWLKGNTEKLKKLEASGKYSGLPVVRLAASSKASSKASFKPTPEDPTELETGGASPTPKGKPVVGSDDLPELRQGKASLRLEEVSPPALREGGPVSSSSYLSSPSSSSPSPEPTEPPLTPSKEVFRPGADEFAATPERGGREAPSAEEELAFREQEKKKQGIKKQGIKKDKAPPTMDDVNEGEDGQKVGGDLSLDAPAQEALEERILLSEPPLSRVATGAVPKSAGRESDRDTHIAERLRRITRMRRAAVEAARLAQIPQRRVMLAVLCTIAILVLGTIFALYRYTRNNSQSAIAQEARTLYEEERYDEAMASYQRGINRYPDSREFLLGLARSSTRAGQSDQALAAWRLYLNQILEEERSSRAQALYEIGRLYAQEKAPDKAIEHLIQSSNLDPTRYDTHFALGRLLEEQNRPAEALSSYRRALELRPSSQEALDAMKRVAGLVVDQPPPAQGPDREYEKRLEVGIVALDLKRYDDALSLFNQALAIKSDDERPWLGVAGAYQGKGNDAEALRLLQDAQKLISGSVTIEAKIDELERRLEQRREQKEKATTASPAKRRRETVGKQ